MPAAMNRYTDHCRLV